MKTFKIGNKEINNKTPFIIAEAGVNHNGSLKLALKLVDMAMGAGADAIKFQTFRANQVVTDVGEMADYQKKNTGVIKSQLAMLKDLEFDESWYPEVIDYCKKKKIIFLSTPHGGFESVKLLNKYRIQAFKFGSGDLTNLPVLQYAASFKKPMVLGTGMATLNEVSEAVKCIKKTGNDKIILLHCTSEYPCPNQDVNLLAMKTLGQKFDLPFGYSDHTIGDHVAIMACAMGASLIEKHITLDKNMPGPDHCTSMEFAELQKMISVVKQTGIILGSPVKKPTLKEIKMKKTVRRSLVASKDIKEGEIFSLENLEIKRPNNGLKPKVFFQIVGKKAKRSIKADSLISLKDITSS